MFVDHEREAEQIECPKNQIALGVVSKEIVERCMGDAARLRGHHVPPTATRVIAGDVLGMNLVKDGRCLIADTYGAWRPRREQQLTIAVRPSGGAKFPRLSCL